MDRHVGSGGNTGGRQGGQIHGCQVAIIAGMDFCRGLARQVVQVRSVNAIAAVGEPHPPCLIVFEILLPRVRMGGTAIIGIHGALVDHFPKGVVLHFLGDYHIGGECRIIRPDQ